MHRLAFLLAGVLAPLVAAGPAAAQSIPASAAFDLPSAKRCVSSGTISLKLRTLERGEWTRLTVSVNGAEAKRVSRPRAGSRVRVQSLPATGAATVKFEARANGGRTARVTRKYHACVAGGKPTVTVPGGTPPTTLVKRDLVAGTGARARRGQQVTVRYVLVTWSDGKEVDATWRPFRFPLGREQVIEGFDLGVRGMRVGGRREVTVPPALGYGDSGSGPIAPDETLVFQIDLVEIH